MRSACKNSLQDGQRRNEERRWAITSLQRLGALQVLSDKSIETVLCWACGAAGTHGVCVCVCVDVDVVARGRIKIRSSDLVCNARFQASVAAVVSVHGACLCVSVIGS